MPVDRPTDPDGLTIKQRAFVHAYVGKAQGNGIQACKLAGYKGSDKTLKALAHKQINHPLISKAIRKVASKVEADGVSSAAERQGLLDDIVWGRVLDTAITKEGKSVSVPANLATRLAANRDLARMRCEMSEKREVDIKGVAEVRVYLPSNGRD